MITRSSDDGFPAKAVHTADGLRRSLASYIPGAELGLSEMSDGKGYSYARSRLVALPLPKYSRLYSDQHL